MLMKEVVFLFVLRTVLKCNAAEFEAPEVVLEAYDPKGFRASIPALDGIQMFAFHMNVNKPITAVEPGDFNEDFTKPTGNNVWSYYNKDLALKVGDEVNYWTFIQYEKLGYRKDATKWTVKELKKSQDTNCETSRSLVARKALVCRGSVILDEKFNGNTIDRNIWLAEEYIPYFISEDFEFVSYQNKSDICYVQNNRLFIKPEPAKNENDVRGVLDLRNRCTKSDEDQCYLRQQLSFILPPVTSGKIYSHLNFRYGKIEIKAKLPAGDWIYPQIYLEQLSNPKKKLYIAYSRGNAHLYASNGNDIGGRLLFAGPVLEPTEPLRSSYLRSINGSKPFFSEAHTYTVIWSKDSMLMLLDGTEYGRISKGEMDIIKFAENDMVKIVLGVGVGGINDFPDDFRTGSDDVKPWRNKERDQVNNFFNAREKWLKTWSGDNSALQVEYVKVTVL